MCGLKKAHEELMSFTLLHVVHGSLPAQVVVGLQFTFSGRYLRKIVIGKEFRFHMANGLLKRFHKFVKILLIKEDFVFFVKETVVFKAPLAFGDGQVIVVASG